MPEQGTKPSQGTALMGVDPATGAAYFVAVDPLTGQLIVQSAAGGDAVTIANGANIVEGSTADAAAAIGGAGTLSAKARLMTTQLATINTTLGVPFQLGGSIGNTTFGISGTLPAFAAVPAVKTDLTTPGTTNAVSVAQLGATTVLTGNGATGAGSQRVTIASDNTAIAVNATLSAETNKVIGAVNQGTSPWVISGPVTQSGTWTVSLPAAGTSVVGSKAAGTAAATSVLEGAIFNSTTPALTDGQQVAAQADTTGARRINTEGGKTTYSASAGFTLPAAATDVFTIKGSASKTVRVTRISISGTATAAAAVAVQMVKRSTADTGGTPSGLTAIPLDSANAAGTAVVQHWGAGLPTVGNSVGTVRFGLLTFTTTGGTIPSVPYVADFGTRNAQSIVLRGTSEMLAINLGTATVTGGTMYADIEWTEE